MKYEVDKDLAIELGRAVFNSHKLFIVTEDELVAQPINTAETKKYPEVFIGKIEEGDDARLEQPSGLITYYIPVGDGLYRPTYSKTTFLYHACRAIYPEFKDLSYGEQYLELRKAGYMKFDLLNALGLKLVDIVYLKRKDNDKLPPYVKLAWERCFSEHCKWHPHAELADLQEAQEVKDLFNVKEERKQEEEVTTDTYPSDGWMEKYGFTIKQGFRHHVTIPHQEGAVDWKKYSDDNPIFAYIRPMERGKGVAYVNNKAFKAWFEDYGKEMFNLKEGKTTVTSFNDILKMLHIPVSAWWREFIPYTSNTPYKIPSKQLEQINEFLGFKLFSIEKAPEKITHYVKNNDDNDETLRTLMKGTKVKHLHELVEPLRTVGFTAAYLARAVKINACRFTRTYTTRPCDAEAVNKFFGYEVVQSPEVEAPKKINKYSETEEKIKSALVSCRKYSIATIKKLFAVTEACGISRADVINTFNLTDPELNNPCDLFKSTAIRINEFVHKSVAIGNI